MGHSSSSISGVSGGGSASGPSLGMQVNSEMISLFKGKLGVRFGFINALSQSFYFHDDSSGERMDYRLSGSRTYVPLNLYWSPKGEMVPYFEYGGYYSNFDGTLWDVDTDEPIENPGIDYWGIIYGGGFKYHKEGSRFVTCLGFQQFIANGSTLENNKFDIGFTTFNLRFEVSFLLF